MKELNNTKSIFWLLDTIVNITHSSSRKEVAEEIRKRAKEVTLLSVEDLKWHYADVYTAIKHVDAEPKQCFKNAARIALALPNFRVSYVEGYVQVAGVPVEHAFNVLCFADDTIYFDATLLRTGDEDNSVEGYVSVMELSQKELADKLFESQMYTSFTNEVIAASLKKM